MSGTLAAILKGMSVPVTCSGPAVCVGHGPLASANYASMSRPAVLDMEYRNVRYAC